VTSFLKQISQDKFGRAYHPHIRKMGLGASRLVVHNLTINGPVTVVVTAAEADISEPGPEPDIAQPGPAPPTPPVGTFTPPPPESGTDLVATACRHEDVRYYCVWYIPGRMESAIYYGTNVVGAARHPTWAAIEGLMPGLEYAGSGASLCRCPSLKAARAKWSAEAHKKGLPSVAAEVCIGCPVCGTGAV
jgi:hypothetical protein